jgi:hypothetical protein
MQPLPNFERAVIPIEKIRDYALNDQHPEGQHKASVFKRMLGIERGHAEVLVERLISTLPSSLAEHAQTDGHGDRWTTYHEIVGLNGQAAIVTVAWIYKKEQEEIPQLISCYIEPEKQDEFRKKLTLARQKHEL